MTRGLVLVGVGYSIANLAWYVAQPPTHAPLPEPPGTGARQAKELDVLVAAHLFGVADSPAQEPAAELAQAEVALALLGTLESSRGASYAIVADGRGQATSYSVGQALPGAGRLVEIDAGRVVVERDGRRRSFIFEPTDASARAGDDVARGNAVGVTEPSSEIIEEAGTSADSSSVSPIDLADQRSLAEGYARMISEDPNGALKTFGIQPVRSQEAAGYRVTQRTPYFDRAGLKPGDVILNVDGASVGDPSLDHLELANLVAVGSTKVVVNRAGETMTITTSDDPLEARRNARESNDADAVADGRSM